MTKLQIHIAFLIAQIKEIFKLATWLGVAYVAWHFIQRYW